MLKVFQYGKPVIEDEPYVYYDIDLESKQKYFQVRANTLLKGMRS
jgi:hypothetical protein